MLPNQFLLSFRDVTEMGTYYYELDHPMLKVYIQAGPD